MTEEWKVFCIIGVSMVSIVFIGAATSSMVAEKNCFAASFSYAILLELSAIALVSIFALVGRLCLRKANHLLEEQEARHLERLKYIRGGD